MAFAGELETYKVAFKPFTKYSRVLGFLEGRYRKRHPAVWIGTSLNFFHRSKAGLYEISESCGCLSAQKIRVVRSP
jgi:hypothetical protein